MIKFISMMTKLSININKPALLRNSRGSNFPDIVQIAKDCERFGAQGITVHPRPDERHITYGDISELKKHVRTEYNIEGYPSKAWMDLVLINKPTQATLVPDPPGALTSNAGWDTVKHQSFLSEVLSELKRAKIRSSLFMENDLHQIDKAKQAGADRIELYTGPYAHQYKADKNKAIQPYTQASKHALEIGLALNAGHDLSLDNLKFFKESIPGLLEVSIGHALWIDAIYVGLENAIMMYRRLL